ncbi:MAG: type I methionyl aminopeptidase [Malacoplasma sp.]
MIYLKNSYEISEIKKACSIWKKVREDITSFVKIGVSLIEIDSLVKSLEKKYDFTCTFYNYNGFPGNICISVNDVVIHGIPTSYKLKNKDLVTFDIGITYNKYVCDAAFTLIVGEETLETKKINEICYQSLMKGIAEIHPNKRIGDISNAIQIHSERNGFKVIKNFGGHGCGKHLHEDPTILNYGEPGTGAKLVPGMILCIEPMLLTDSDDYYISSDKWSVVSSNHLLTCHWEHMVLVTSDGYEILTE